MSNQKLNELRGQFGILFGKLFGAGDMDESGGLFGRVAELERTMEGRLSKVAKKNRSAHERLNGVEHRIAELEREVKRLCELRMSDRSDIDALESRMEPDYIQAIRSKDALEARQPAPEPEQGWETDCHGKLVYGLMTYNAVDVVGLLNHHHLTPGSKPVAKETGRRLEAAVSRWCWEENDDECLMDLYALCEWVRTICGPSEETGRT